MRIHSCSSFYVIEPQSFVYKQKRQYKLLKSRLHFKKITDFTGKLLQNYKYLECEIFRILLKQVSDHLSVLFSICMTVPLNSIHHFNPPDANLHNCHYCIKVIFVQKTATPGRRFFITFCHPIRFNILMLSRKRSLFPFQFPFLYICFKKWWF